MNTTISEVKPDTLFPIQKAKYDDSDLIDDTVVELVRDVPALYFQGPIREVVAQLKEFEDQFRFVPVMRPRVEGDYYLANRYQAEDPTVLPEYSQTSEYYCLLKSYETLEALADALGDHILAKVAVQKQISVSLYDETISVDKPIVYYLNSYNRSTREKIIMAFAFLGFHYMHRRSGTEKEDFTNVTDFLQDDNYKKATQLMADYPISLKEFKRVCKKVQLPLKRLAYHMFGVDKGTWVANEEQDSTEELMYNLFKSRYSQRNEGKANLLHLIQWFHDIYRFNTKNERFDVATRMLDLASTYLTKTLLVDAKVSELL